jgi:hypothetical protein
MDFFRNHFNLIITQAFKQQTFGGLTIELIIDQIILKCNLQKHLSALALGSRKTNSQATNMVFVSERAMNTVSAHNQSKQSKL